MPSRDRVLLGYCSLLLSPRRIARSAIIIKLSTLLRFHNALKKWKYRQLYSPGSGRKSGPKGATKEAIDAIVDIKRRKPGYDCPRIAQQINLAFGLELDKDVVRRILATHYKPAPNNHGPSRQTAIGHTKDSLWSVDLLRCDSILLKTHRVTVVMGQYTRSIIGLAVYACKVDGPALCRMFNDATSGQGQPKYISSDNDPLFYYHRLKATLHILEVEELKTLPHVPMSHPFVERLIGSVRRELLDQTLFWTVTELENKLQNYQLYYNKFRVHSGRDGSAPITIPGGIFVAIKKYGWQNYCRGLFELTIVA